MCYPGSSLPGLCPCIMETALIATSSSLALCGLRNKAHPSTQLLTQRAALFSLTARKRQSRLTAFSSSPNLKPEVTRPNVFRDQADKVKGCHGSSVRNTQRFLTTWFHLWYGMDMKSYRSSVRGDNRVSVVIHASAFLLGRPREGAVGSQWPHGHHQQAVMTIQLQKIMAMWEWACCYQIFWVFQTKPEIEIFVAFCNFKC